MARLSATEAGGLNVLAFLDMIAFSEIGAKLLASSDDGYNVLVGGTLFASYSDHPRVLVPLPKLGIKSTAAGRYQELSRNYDVYRKQLGLSNFGPCNQDRMAIQQIKECRALVLIQQGKIPEAVNACRKIWASLPGAGYGQHENALPPLLDAYAQAGGTCAPGNPRL